MASLKSILFLKMFDRLLCNQKQEITEMQSMIDDFNDGIYEARKERLPVLIKGYFIDIFVVCLNEELRILKSCEEEEDKLSNNVNAKLKDVHDMEVMLLLTDKNPN